MRDRLVKFEFEQEALTDYDRTGKRSKSPSSALSATAAPVAAVDKEFEIEAVVDMKRWATDGSWRYRVKWRGYPTSDNTWEPSDSFNDASLWKGFPKKVASLMSKTGTDEDTALKLLRRCEWDVAQAAKMAKQQIQQAKEKEDEAAALKLQQSLQRADSGLRSRREESSEEESKPSPKRRSPEPSDTEVAALTEDDSAAAAKPPPSAANKRQKVDSSDQADGEDRLTFEQEAISCDVCGTASAARLRRGKCEDGQIYCGDCYGLGTLSTSPVETPRDSPSPQGWGNPPAAGSGSAAVAAKDSHAGEKTVDRDEKRRDRARDRDRERDRRRDRDRDYRRRSRSRSRDRERERSRRSDDARGHRKESSRPVDINHSEPGRFQGECTRRPAGTAGFGFIRRPNQPDLFYHASAVIAGPVNVSDRVSFKLGRNRKGDCAVEVAVMARPPPGGHPPLAASRPAHESSRVAREPHEPHRHRSPRTERTVEKLRDDIGKKQDNGRSNSERFFMRHFAAVHALFGQRPVQQSVREINSETVDHLWECLVAGQHGGFEKDTLDHVASLRLADHPSGFHAQRFDALVRAKMRVQHTAERQSGRSAAGEVWRLLGGMSCEIDLKDKAYDMQRINQPARGARCTHPKSFDARTHVQEKIKQDRRKVWEAATTILAVDFAQGLEASRLPEHTRSQDSRKNRAKEERSYCDLLKECLKNLPIPREAFPPGATMMGRPDQFLNGLRSTLRSEMQFHQHFVREFESFWRGPRGDRWRKLYVDGPSPVLMGKWACPFCPGGAPAAWSDLVIDDSLGKLLTKVCSECGDDTESVEVRCCGANEVEAEGEGWRSGSCVPAPAAHFREPCLTPRSFRRVPLAVAGQLGGEGLMLGWTAASEEAAEEEEEFDLT